MEKRSEYVLTTFNLPYNLLPRTLQWAALHALSSSGDVLPIGMGLFLLSSGGDHCCAPIVRKVVAPVQLRERET